MIRVLGRKTSGNVQKVVWMLEELGTPYQREDYGRQFNNTADEKYLSLNPNGKVPTLIDGDTVIWESNSILRYLAAKNGNKLYAADPASRSKIERWMDWQLATLDGAYLPVFREAKTPPAERSAAFGDAVKGMGAALNIIERGMQGGAWAAGNDITIADIAMGPAVGRCFGFGVDLPELPNVRKWHAAFSARPGYKKATG